MFRPALFPIQLTLVWLLFSFGICLAQESEQASDNTAMPLPAWVVLVLEPTGQNRVRPVSGVVIAESGLVVVPLDFASSSDQIIVLDGGTDLVSHGKAARILSTHPDVGLSVLSVDGLRRKPPVLSATSLSATDSIRLSAFPPAELIARGEAPVDVSTALSDLEKALPNVTGPLLDICGNLVGLSIAEGVQSMDTNLKPAYLWVDDLKSVLDQLDLQLQEKQCPEPELTESQQPETESTESEDEASEAVPAERDDSLDWVDVDQAQDATVPPPFLWLGLGVFVVLTVAAWLLFRRRAAGSEHPHEPDGETLAVGMRSADSSQKNLQQPHHQFAHNDSVFEINGHRANGKPFVASCEVSAAAINVVIGRNAADINIDSQEVQREHALFGGSADELTVSDLGSSRGTWINAVPCLKGEIMYLEEDDTIYLGNVSFTISVRPLRTENQSS